MSEAAQLRPTPYGEVFDVVLSDIAPAQLAAYRAVLLVGDLDFNSSQLVEALRSTTLQELGCRYWQSNGIVQKSGPWPDQIVKETLNISYKNPKPPF